MNKRKLIIGLVTFTLMLAVYFVYNMLVFTPDMTVDTSKDGEGSVKAGDFDKKGGSLGDTRKVAPVGEGEYVTLDETTKEVKRILGFATLEKPSKNSDIWVMEKPYIKLFDDKLKCNIESDRGKVRVEMFGNQPSPVTAELEGNVEIIIQMQDGNKEITIELDDLLYDNERSEFATEGPVKLISEDGEMKGEGMIMLYDAEVGKLAYLEITKLEYLLLKKVVKTDVVKDGSDAPAGIDTPTKPAKAEVTGNDPAVAGKENKKPEVAGSDPGQTDAIAATEDVKYKYYQCSLNDTVTIEYGKKIVIVGADEVVISNILGFEKASDDKKSDKPSEAKGNADVADSALATSKPVAADTVSVEEKPVAKDTAESAENSDIYVTCKGSLIIRPMELAGRKRKPLNADHTRRMEIRGRPVKVGQFAEKGSEEIETIASCGEVIYDIDNEVLDLETGGDDRFIELNMADNEASIYTEGSIKWSRRANHASIVGPGMLLVSEEQSQGDSSNMKFNGTMDVYFADRDVNGQAGELSLSMVNLVGGMVATINKDDDTTVASDTAKFTFDEGKYITAADLGGNVKFRSGGGMMQSNTAKILFAKNEEGKVIPINVSGTGDAILEPAQECGSRPTRFYAKKINYDMSTKVAIATGPVKFEFYASDENADPNSSGEKIPVVIKAQTDARLYQQENQIVFNGDVIGEQVTVKNGITQRDTFTGDQLIVDLSDGEENGIDHILIVGGQVQLQSERKMDDVVIGNIVLSCLQIDWESADNLIIAKGPGEIEINNENAPEVESTNEEDSTFKLAGPCLAVMSGFKTLLWSLDKGEIEVDGGEGSVNIGYMPIKNGERGQIVKATVGKIICNAIEREDGRFDLANVKTLGGIFYEEVGKHSILGETMDYDAVTGIMSIAGEENSPCLIDGRIKAEFVEYDMKTGNIISRLKR